jgi:hypothetical protein
MDAVAGPSARRALPIASALLLTTAWSPGVTAQDGSPTPTPEPVSPAATGDEQAALKATTPGRLKPVMYPKGGLGLRVFDLIEGGPGYIAVGGGTPTGLDHMAFVWLSDDGLHWQSAPLFGDAARGTMRAVAELPDGGFVAVGHDFMPQTQREELTHAIAWYSADGYGWQRVPADESFPGSLMWDVTSTPTGVAAAGCVAGFHCDVGRVWTSADGFTWELTDGIAMAPYDIAANAAGDVVIAGEDDAYDLILGQASAASSAEDWTVRVFASGDSQIQGAAPYGEGFLLVGSLRSTTDGSIIGSALQVSEDGIDWSPLELEELQQVYTLDVDTAGDLVAIVGRDYGKKRIPPLVLWTRDLESFETVKLPRKLDVDAFGAEDVRLTDDGSRLFVFGTDASRPAIWTTTFE